jgi:hypothetical protein
MRHTIASLGLLAALLVPGLALAQGDPSFKYAKPEDVKPEKSDVEWKATGKASLVISGGNSRATALSGSVAASRKGGSNKIALEAGGAYVSASVLTATDGNANGTIEKGEIGRETKTTTNQWNAKIRYDRFLSENNSLYLAGLIGGDEPAGKKLLGGAQLGYSRQLISTERHMLLLEAGYDFSYEAYVEEGNDAVSIHSARVFTGYNLKLSATTSAFTNIEFLFNLNKETAPKEDGSTDVGSFEDFRTYWKTGLTTTLWKNLSFGFDFLLKFDNVPAPLGKIGALPFAAGYVPVAEKLDVVGQVSLLINFI